MERCHKQWWAVVQDEAQNGKDTAAAFQALCEADKPLPKQRLVPVSAEVSAGASGKRAGVSCFSDSKPSCLSRG